jgi:HPt (histidine-containing phosphotransfer) domain-containing protein
MVKLDRILEKWIPKAKHIRKMVKITGVNEEIVRDVGADMPIEGLDVVKGVFQSGGTVELYLRTIATFLDDGREKMDEIKKCLAANELALYAIYVHALKSAAENIGAHDLSAAAKKLEAAGKQEDLAYIETYNDKFLADLETLLGNIGNALSLRSENKNKPAPLSPELIEDELLKLKAALESMDAWAISKAVNSLEESARTGDMGALVRNISKNILMAEYDEAVAQIDVFLQSTFP